MASKNNGRLSKQREIELKRRKKRKSRLIIAIIIGIIVYLLNAETFFLQNIEITGNEQITAEEIIEQLGLEKGKSIFSKLNIVTKVKLKQNGFINVKLYVISFISDKVRLSNYGPNKIRNELSNLNINSDLIEEELSNYPKDEILNNLEKLIDKKIRSNKNYGENILKQKIISEFLNKGYYKEDILNILDNKNLSNDDLYDKEYKKLYTKYSKKYSGEQLEYFIKQKLYQKGLKKMQ